MAGWIPKNWDEVCKRNAGRRKLHMRKRLERADRIARLLPIFDTVPELRESSYGWLAIAAQTMKRSVATASRDFALCRRIRGEFARMFGREFKAGEDYVVWSWDISHYGFMARESVRAGHRKPVGKFSFVTRKTLIDEASYCGFNPLSWQDKSGDFLSLLKALKRIRI